MTAQRIRTLKMPFVCGGGLVATVLKPASEPRGPVFSAAYILGYVFLFGQ